MENVQQFLENQGHSEEAISVGLSVDKLVSLKTSVHHKHQFLTFLNPYNMYMKLTELDLIVIIRE